MILPAKNEYLPIFSDSFLPSQKPKQVKIALMMQKDNKDIKILS